MKASGVNQTWHRLRRRRGASTVIVALLSLLLIVVLVIALQTMVVLNGSQEMKNSVDAGVLNMAKGSLTQRVPAPVESNFNDMADCSECIELTNINRVWGKAYLVNANAEDMQKTGFANGGTPATNGRNLWTRAQRLSDSLYDQLKTKDWADVSFGQLSKAKGARLLGTGGVVLPSKKNNIDVAYLYRGEESNIWYDPGEMPGAVKPNSISHNNTLYLQGYNPMEANGKTFCFTTFHADESPHLVSMDTFSKWKGPVNGSQAQPTPNAFSHAGDMTGTVSLNAAAASVSNPMKTFPLKFAKAFVTIQISNTANWFVQGQMVNTQPYSPSTGKVWGARSILLKKPAKGILNGYGSLGNEYRKLTLYDVMTALPGDHEPAMQKLLVRVKQMKPGYTADQLVKFLHRPYPKTATNYQVMIYINEDCSGAPKDLQTFETFGEAAVDGRAGAEKTIGDKPNFAILETHDAEGIAKKLFDEDTLNNAPNTCWSNIIGPYSTDKHSTVETGECTWQPGTGYYNDLGTLSFSRVTNIVFTGLP